MSSFLFFSRFGEEFIGKMFRYQKCYQQLLNAETHSDKVWILSFSIKYFQTGDWDSMKEGFEERVRKADFGES